MRPANRKWSQQVKKPPASTTKRGLLSLFLVYND